MRQGQLAWPQDEPRVAKGIARLQNLLLRLVRVKVGVGVGVGVRLRVRVGVNVRVRVRLRARPDGSMERLLA